MKKRTVTSLPVTIRVYPQPQEIEKEAWERRPWNLPEAMFIFDTETRTDETQRLTFGSYRFIVAGRCSEEGLFYGDDLPDHDRQTLEEYVSTHEPDTVGSGYPKLRLLRREQFAKRLYRAAYNARCLLVAFNFPFDAARVACDFAEARERFSGGFSLGLFSYLDEAGSQRHDPHRARISIKHIDSKRALKGFTGAHDLDKPDRIPEGSETGKAEDKYFFRGHFLDLRTLAFALTDRGHSLETACKAFEVEHGKQRPTRHGEVTEGYINYNRRDVLATWELAEKLLEEYAKHPITLQVTKAYSPASIGKAYLREMGIKPVLERQPEFPRKYLGYAQSAFFGGRASAHIRKVAVPVVYCDFLSMYPTVNSLMGLWRFVVAEKINVIEHCQEEIEEFLQRVNADELFKPETWEKLAGFVRIVPDGEILPSRAQYSIETNDWQVAVNYLCAKNDEPKDALWFSLPDIVASVIHTGRIPKILDAFHIEASGTLQGLNPIKLRGAVRVDPATEDLFKVAIEERRRLSRNATLSKIEKERLDKALKALANATSYGIYAEMNRQESDEPVNVTCYGIDPEPFTCRVGHPDVPGEYCFPPLASLITGGARLMLSLLEYCVWKKGGTHGMEDTDSMAIVSTQHGGSITCNGTTIHALSWKEVGEISDRFTALNPYNRDAVSGSILKIEDDNRDPETGNPRQIYCLAISAKRYALFIFDQGEPVLLRKGVNNNDDRWSEHGLGHLLNPTDPEADDREWIAQVWLKIIRRALSLPVQRLGFEDLPAIGRITISSPVVLRPLAKLNAGKSYVDQIKPFNFILTCHIKQLGHPPGVEAERFHLIAPYDSDPRQWLKKNWIDQYSGKTFRITTAKFHGDRRTARVKTYGEVIREYEFHAESKCADMNGIQCAKQSVGLLQRRHVEIQEIKAIGKESNSSEEVESGLIHSPQNVYTEYPDPRCDEWETKIIPALREIPLPRLEKLSGMSRRALIYARVGRMRPHKKHQEVLVRIVTQMKKTMHDPEMED